MGCLHNSYHDKRYHYALITFQYWQQKITGDKQCHNQSNNNFTQKYFLKSKRTRMLYCTVTETSNHCPSETLCPGVFLHKGIYDFFQSEVWNELILRQVSSCNWIKMTNSLQINKNTSAPLHNAHESANISPNTVK